MSPSGTVKMMHVNVCCTRSVSSLTSCATKLSNPYPKRKVKRLRVLAADCVKKISTPKHRAESKFFFKASKT